MAKASIPEGVERTTRGRLIVQRWVRDPSDPVATADASTRHAAWLAPLIDPPLMFGWNDAGHSMFNPPVVRSAAPLELYDGHDEIAFQRIAAVGDTAWQTAARVLAARCLDDGRPVTGVVLVAKDAADAMVLHDAARAAGFARVVYPDASEPGTFWDPHPPGDWLLVPRQPR